MTKLEKIAFGLLAILTVFAFIFWKDIRSFTGKKAGPTKVKSEKNDSAKKKSKKNKQENTKAFDSSIKIVQKWDMPSDLKEISGIAYVGKNRFACVQDELGKIFIFNTATGEVEKKIQFAGSGDYEGITIVGETAYIMRADGKLFELKNYSSEKPSLVEHDTHLTAKQDVEGLCYDEKNNRLLLAIKGREPNSKDYKGIYAFDLASKKIATTPAIKIDLTHNIWSGTKSKNKIQPSDIDVHPVTGDVYIIDGPDSKLLVMGADGTKKKLYQLSNTDFPQPEGMAFNQAGELFISNEGRTGTGNILKISFNEDL
jgi:uncharacterized protein YjiK